VDPVTHIAAGALIGQSLRKKFPGKGIVWFAMAAAWIPDVDNAAAFFSPEFYLLYHRGVTHSFVGGAAIALILAAVYRLIERKGSFWVYAGVAYGCVLSHIFLDVITSYGTMIFAPMSNVRYSLHSVFIIDPIYSGVMLTILIFSFAVRNKRTIIALIGLGWIALYPLANYALAQSLEKSLAAGFNDKGIAYERVDVTADALSPLYWKVVTREKDRYTISYVALWNSGEPEGQEDFHVADPVIMRRFGRKASIFNTYQWFALYPYSIRDNSGNGTKIVIGDLRFYSVSPIAKGLLSRRKTPFVLTAYLDGGGNLVKYSYQRPGRVIFVQHIQ